MNIVELSVTSCLLCILVLPCMLLFGWPLTFRTLFIAWGVSYMTIGTLIGVASWAAWLKRRFSPGSDKLE